MMSESLTTLQIGAQGTVGDRLWAVWDEVRGGIRGARKIPRLMKLPANLVGQAATDGSSPALIKGLDGSTMETDADDINRWLSAQLQHEVVEGGTVTLGDTLDIV